MNEPTPPHGDEAIPDVVLDELRSAFSGSAAVDEDTAFAHRASAPDRGKPGKPGKAPKSGKSGKPGKPGTAPTSGTPSAPAPSTAAPKLTRAERKAARRSAATEVPDRTDGFESVRVLPADTTAPTRRTDRKAASEQRAEARRSASNPPAGGAARSTIMIGGDDLPDAQYLDEEAEPRLKELYGGDTGGGSGAIILGNELDSSGAFDAVSPPARSMDPRVRARRIAVKRAAGRKRLIWVGAIGLVVALVVGTLAVFASSLFAVRADDVSITGAVYTSPSDLQQVVDGVVGDPVLLVDSQDVERRLEALPWIERAIVTTKFPHHLGIDIRERFPLATFVGTDGRYRVIDREGRVLAVLDNQPVAYMVLTGPAPDTEAGSFAGAPYANAAQLVSALPAEIRAITTSISVDSSTGDLGLLLQPNLPVRLGGFNDMDTKLARILQYMRSEGGLSGCVRVDVSTGEVSCATR